jgi:hypothetical protein
MREILKDDLVMQVLGLENGAEVDRIPPTSLSIPITVLFNTGLNMIVLGEAGAGKTTSLQNHAANQLNNLRLDELVVFAPLARLIDAWTKDEGKLNERASKRLENGIAAYLRRLGLDLDAGSISRIFEKSGGVALLDGVDEAIKTSPWIARAIASMADRFPKVQVITSSRISAKSFEEIPFSAITLLPFTDRQREQFVQSWFVEEPNYAAKIKKHLTKNKDLGEVVRNPLLSTILCVLQEHNVKLPNNEIRLYEERMRLLLGDYDAQKEVRRVASQRYALRLASQKLAFRLHASVRREAEFTELCEWTARMLKKQISKAESQVVVAELLDPCNVLCVMSGDGQLGFGHLRYQEYLAALELLQNRSIDILTLARNPWWRGALALFSQLNESIDWFIGSFIERCEILTIKDTALAMIQARPTSERAALRSLVSKHAELDLEITDYLDDYDEINFGISDRLQNGMPDEFDE